MQQKRIKSTKATKSLIKPAEYARRRGLNRSTVSRQIADGKIPVHDGLVNCREADAARRANLDMRRGRRKQPKARAARAIDFDLDAVMVGAQTELLDRVRENAGRLLPELARRLGLPEYVAIGAPDVFDSILARCGVEPDDPMGPDPLDYWWPPLGAQLEAIEPYRERPDDEPRPETEVQRQADELYERIDKLFDAIKEAPAATAATRGNRNETQS